MMRSFIHDTTSGLSLGLFRIAFGSVLTAEILHLWYFQELIFRPLGSDSSAQFHPSFILMFWIVAAVCLTIGLFTKYAAVVNYVCCVSVLSNFTIFEYHIDYIYITAAIYMVFAPIGLRLSVDSCLAARSGSSAPREPIQVPYAWNLTLVFLAIGLVYFDSAIFKWRSDMWLAGLGMWQPASHPAATFVDLTPILNREWLVKLLSYTVLIFESLFLLIMWFRPIQPALMLLGIAFHLGILLAFPIPFFALAVVSCYLVLLPESWIKRVLFWIPTLSDAAAQEVPRTAADEAAESKLPSSLGIHQRRTVWGLACVMMVAFVMQLLCRTNPQALQKPLGLDAGSLSQLQDRLDGFRYYARAFTGITLHPVFMDRHFSEYNHVVRVVFVDDSSGNVMPVPIQRDSGQVSWYSSGRMWVYDCFRCVGPTIVPDQLQANLERVCFFWASKNDVDLASGHFEVFAKHVDTANGWEKDFLRKQLAKPWQPVGQFRWNGDSFEGRIEDVERLVTEDPPSQ
ncbi:Vitamin K-dependent gamma-carboxylase [Bremerella volcania]|uniref:Vitamin K-dependent gamma-carboxylase n=1 Tax=Bremerella volcania TaxID=2527984 RepID=A0A518C851_9BACT|nr:HTTM domain-containing protein [Bremerella volcania]QDU75405.1 Vitamin K-dependent gamma-carboxylase [Bremerella volcania]